MLHLGTLIAVVFVYRQLIWRLIKEFGSLCVDIADVYKRQDNPPHGFSRLKLGGIFRPGSQKFLVRERCV